METDDEELEQKNQVVEMKYVDGSSRRLKDKIRKMQDEEQKKDQKGKISNKAGNSKGTKDLSKTRSDEEQEDNQGNEISNPLLQWLAPKRKRKAVERSSMNVAGTKRKGPKVGVKPKVSSVERELLKLLESPVDDHDFAGVAVDDVDAYLLPDDVDGLPRTSRTIKCKGGGNCLFHAVSMLLCGDADRFAAQLRKLACDFMTNNVDYMVNHPALKSAATELRRPEEFVFPHALSMVTQNLWDKKKDRESLLLKEAAICQKPSTYASMLVFLALVEVIKRPVTSIYPLCNERVRPLFHQKVVPRDVVEENSWFLLWSKDVELDKDEEMFKANHFVPVV